MLDTARDDERGEGIYEMNSKPRIAVLYLHTGLALALLMLVSPRELWACAACACGDPTLTVMGTEKPFAGRFRLSLELQHRSDEVGLDRVNRIELSEQRLDLGLSYVPYSWLGFSLRAPLIRRDVREVNLAQTERVRFGDLEVRAHFFPLEHKTMNQRHVLQLILGAELPTGSIEHDAAGRPLRPEIQPGSGSVDPFAGVAYGLFLSPLSFYASATVYVPTEGFAEIRGGTALRSSLTAQYDFSSVIGARLSLDSRLEDRTEMHGEVEPDTGGFIAYVSPELVVSPLTDLILRAVVRIPVIDALYGAHDEGPMFLVGAAHDF